MAFFVGGKYVMIRDHCDPFGVEDARLIAELLFEDADCAGATDVVCHQYINVHPHVLAGLDRILARVRGENLFRHRHFVWHKGIPHIVVNMRTDLLL